MLGAGNFLDVALEHANAIAVFSVSSTGGLSQIPGSSFPAGHGTSSLATASGFLYALNSSDHTISVFTIDPLAGSLAPAPASTVTAGTASGQLLYNNGMLYAPDPTANSGFLGESDDWRAHTAHGFALCCRGGADCFGGSELSCC
jgi:hypothetical protein